MTVHSAIWSPPKMLPCTSRKSTTRIPRAVSNRKSTWKPAPIPSGTSMSTR